MSKNLREDRKACGVGSEGEVGWRGAGVGLGPWRQSPGSLARSLCGRLREAPEGPGRRRPCGLEEKARWQDCVARLCEEIV